MKHFFLALLCLFLALTVNAQKKQFSEKDYAREPLWITMITDTSVNFFEAEKAFTIYFENHKKPGGEHDIIGEHAKNEKHPSKKEQTRMQQDDRMRMEIKKYEHWHMLMLPYVQPGGRILTPSERLKIWESQKNK